MTHLLYPTLKERKRARNERAALLPISEAILLKNQESFTYLPLKAYFRNILQK
jgi:hypothetical protein